MREIFANDALIKFSLVANINKIVNQKYNPQFIYVLYRLLTCNFLA